MIKLNKCVCGSKNLDVVKEGKGIRITCKDCGKSLFVPTGDEFLVNLYSSLIEAANRLQSDYISHVWNESNKNYKK